MTEKENVATYARIRPYNPAINEDKRLTARCVSGCKILNQNGGNEDTYNFTKVYDMVESTNDLFETGMKPLLDYKILQGINSIFIVYGQSGSGKSFTLIGEDGHLGVLPMALQYLLKQEQVQHVFVSSIEAYGIKATKIGFYDLVHQLKCKKENPATFDAYSSKDNSRVNSSNAERIEITHKNALNIITELQEVSHMAPTLKNPHSSRGHTVYFNAVKMTGLEDVYFIAVDLAGSEGQTALGTKDEFVEGLKLAMSKGKLKLNKKQMKGFETMYKTRSLEAGCINNGLTQLQTIFGELIRKKISKSMGLGLRKVLSSFISLKSAYAILFTLSASANNNKVTRATLNFAKQTQLVKVDTQKAKAKIDKDKIIKELNAMIEELRKEMAQKNDKIKELKQDISNAGVVRASATDVFGGDDSKTIDDDDDAPPLLGLPSDPRPSMQRMSSAMVLEAGDEVFNKYEELIGQLTQAEEEEAQWKVADEMVNPCMMNDEAEMKAIFDEFDEDGGGSIDAEELQHALTKMGQNMTMEEVNECIADIDENGDGEVDFDEWKIMVGKSWFVNAFQSKLVASMERMMTNMNLLTEESDDIDSEDHKEEDNEEILQEIQTKNGIIEDLHEQLKANEVRQYEEIERLKNEMQSLKTEYMEKNRYKKEEEEKWKDEMRSSLNGMQNENDKLKDEMVVLKEENGALKESVERLKHRNDEIENHLHAVTKEKDELKEALDALRHENKKLKENNEINTHHGMNGILSESDDTNVSNLRKQRNRNHGYMKEQHSSVSETDEEEDTNVNEQNPQDSNIIYSTFQALLEGLV
eukprot:184081_1